jgi:ankyrin repeat protein
MRPPLAPPPYAVLDRKGVRAVDESHENNFSSIFNTDLPPRPGTSGGVARPKTAGAARGLSNFSNLSFQTPDVDVAAATSATAVLQRELNSDSLLRILNEKSAFKSNEMIMMAEVGDAAGIISLLESGYDLLSCRGLAGYTPLHHACNRG